MIYFRQSGGRWFVLLVSDESLRPRLLAHLESLGTRVVDSHDEL